MTGIDGYDWSVFGGGNPVPGDPDAVRRAARTLADDADHVRRQNRVLQGSTQDALEDWVGPAASGFSSLVGHLGPQLTAMVAAFEDASTAADAYASALRHAQTKAVTALHRAQAAKADIHSAAAQVASLGGKVTTAAAAYDAATGFGGHEMSAPAPPSTPAAKAHEANLLTAYQSASADLGRADDALSAAHTAMAHAVALKDHAVSEAASAAVTFAGAMERAMKSPGHGTGKAGDDFVHFLVDKAPDVAADLLALPMERVEKAEDAMKEAAKDMSRAGRDMRTGATPAERSAGAKLMAEARADKGEAAADLEQAEKLTGVAGGTVGKVSSVLSYSASDLRSDVLDKLADDPDAVSDLDGALGDVADHVPVLGTLLTGVTTVDAVKDGKYLDAGGDVAGFGAAVTTSVLLASNPVGWAIAGSIGAGVVVSWGVDHYKTLEHWADDVGHGVSEGFDKVTHVASSVWHDTIGSIF